MTMRLYWSYAVVDGKTYYYDVDIEVQNLGKTSSEYTWYKKTKPEATQNHSFQRDDAIKKYQCVIQLDPDIIFTKWAAGE